MKTVFYCTRPDTFDAENFCITHMPPVSQELLSLKESHGDESFSLALSLPAFFLADYSNGKIIPSALETIFFEENDDADSFTEKILSLKPDAAINASYWTSPYDWLSSLDALVAEKLSRKGVKVLSPSVAASLLCFDKAQTKAFLKAKNFLTADYVYINHDLYFKTSRSMKINVYRQCVLEEIKQLHFPVIIKDTTGASSVGLDVMNSFEDVEKYLNSRRNNSDRIVEEFLTGPQFGVEIESCETGHKVLPPFMFSVNRYGITSPKQSVKTGPAASASFNLKELEKEMLRLAEELHFKGITQIDLVFHENKWFIIEINPRLSGMTRTYAAASGISSLETLLSLSKNKIIEKQFKPSLNIKLPILSQSQIDKIKDFKNLKYLCQTENKKASQIRERGYTEIIFTAETFSLLEETLEEFSSQFPEVMESIFLNNARKLFKEINL